MAAVKRKEQLARTRAALLDAAMMSLVENGYARTTTQKIQERTGVSRGALLHHFGSKAELLVASVHHIAELRLESIRKVAMSASESPDPLRQVVNAIVDAQSGPPFQAAMELWTAARTDPVLLAELEPAERRLGQALRALFDQHSTFDDPRQARVAFESLLAILRGVEVTRPMRRDGELNARIIDFWFDAAITWPRPATPTRP